MNIFPVRDGPVRVEGKRSWKTIGAALHGAADGDTITILPGDYVEHLRIRIGVTIQASGPGVRIVGTQDGPTILTASNVTLRRLEVVFAGSSSDAAIYAERGELQIEECQVRSTCAGAVAVGAGVTMRIVDSCFHDIRENSVVYANGAGGVFERNAITNVEGLGILVAGEGSSVVIRENQIASTGSFGIQVRVRASATVESNNLSDTRGSGIVCSDTETRVRIERNHVARSQSHGIEVGGCRNAIIEGNRVSDSALSGVSIYGDTATAEATGNTIAGARGHGIQVINGASAELSGNVIETTPNAGVIAGEPSTRVVMKHNRIFDAAVGILVVDQAEAELVENDVQSNGHCLHVRGAGSSAQADDNRFTSPVPDSTPEDGPGATRTVKAGDIAVVLVNRGAHAVVRRNRIVGGRMALTFVSGSLLDAQDNVQDVGGVLRPARIVELFSEDILVGD
ncbi:MAG: right-handed parallel beta-helix repeat-containing protein [Dehalococcoidia bacterium]|nr:right-handed parallel beta-helix repeat-containing protein [Dehalococcoidia bacterium]